MRAFSYVGNPCRVVFGPGKISSVSVEIDRLGAKRIMFCCTPGRKEQVTHLAQAFDDYNVKVCPIAKSIVSEDLVVEGRRAAKEFGADCLVTYGGGSALGLAKSIALEFDVPIIAIVTTYSGSETTEFQGMFEDGKRVLKRSKRMQPETIIYDPELSVDLPLDISIPSAINTMAHAVGSFTSENPNPVTSMFAEEGLRSMRNALPRIADNPRDVDARGDALYGSWLCGSTVNSSGVGFHHKVCHVLGGYFKLPHAITHTVILPHSTGYNREFVPDAMIRIARAFGNENGDAAGEIFDFLKQIGTPTALKDIGMSESDLDEAAKLITTDPYFSPRPVEYDPVRELLDDAWLGRRPVIN